MAAGGDNFSFSGNLKTYRGRMLYRVAYATSVQPQINLSLQEQIWFLIASLSLFYQGLSTA